MVALHAVLLYPEQGCWFSVVAVAVSTCVAVAPCAVRPAVRSGCSRSAATALPHCFSQLGSGFGQTNLFSSIFTLKCYMEKTNKKKNQQQIEFAAILRAAVYLKRPFSGSFWGELGGDVPCLSSASGCGPGAPTWRHPRGVHRPLPGT